MADSYLNKTGLSYFWGKIKAWGSSVFAPIIHTHTSYAVKHSYTTAANQAKAWMRIANANTHQMDTSKPLHVQFLLTAWNPNQAADYYEQWFVDCQVFGRSSGLRIFGASGAPFSQARVLYESTNADIDTNDRPAIDIYLNYALATACHVEIQEVYNSGWTFLADGVLAASTVPTGFENRAVGVYGSGVASAGYCDYATRTRLLRSNITSNITLANNDTYRSRVLNCTNAITITVPSLDSDYAWFLIKNFNAISTNKNVTIHPSTTSVKIDDSNADIVLKPGEWVIIASKAANSYTLIGDGRWKSQKADKATTLAGYGITDAKIANGTITLGSNSITPLTSHQTLPTLSRTISGSGNAITDITVSNHAITATKGATFLTSHQTLPTLSKTDSGSGNAVTAISVSNHAITVTKGSTFALDNNVIHKNSNEAIEGIKEFSNSYHDSTRVGETDWESSSILLRLKNYDKGTVPTTAHFGNLIILDKDGTNQNWNGRLGIFEYSVSPEYGNITRMAAFKNEVVNGVDTHDNAILGVGYDTNGIKYASAPSTSEDRTDIRDILTRDWIPKDTRIVHTTGNESISGVKVFENNIAEKRVSLAKGEAPSENLYYNFVFVDKNSTTPDIGMAKRFGGLETLVSTNKDTSTYLIAYQNIANGTANVSLGVTTNSTYDFDFRYAFVRNGNFKLFDSYSYICIANSDFIRGTTPSTTLYDAPIKFMDANGNLFSEIYCVYNTDKANYVSFLVAKGTDTSNTTEQLGIGFNGDGDAYTRCPHPADASNTWNIATTYWVRRYCEVTKGFLTSHQSLSNYVTLNSAQTISGAKTFSSSIISNTNPIIKRANTTGHVDICGGSGTGASEGGKIVLRGSSETSGTAGEAILQGGDSSGYRYIAVQPDMIYVANNGFAFDKYHSSYTLKFAEDYPNCGAYIYAGAQNFDGAGLMLFGRTQDSANGNHGKFYLRASRKSSSSGTEAMRVLTGTPDGSIYWNGQAIQTSSDERLKTAFAPVDDSILDGWDNVNWIQFKYKDAVAEKGTNARYHVGLVAQHVSRQFEDLETQIEKYGIVCHEYEKEHYIESTVVDAQAYTDDEGVYHEEKSHAEKEFMPGRDEWTVRYTEALCMEAAYMRRENERLKRRIADLEDRLAALELKIS